MNKKLISLAVAAALAAPLAVSAETTLYGRLDTMLNYIDGPQTEFDLSEDGDLDDVVSDVDGEWDVNSNTTRIGVKGSEDLGNGLKAIFQAEWAFNSADGGSTAGGLRNRLAYAGLSGGWGTAAIGRQWTPYYGAVDKTDVFNNSAYNAYYIGSFRTGNAISYVSPNMNGFSLLGAIVVENDVDADNSGQNGIDHYNLAAKYDNGPISLGAGYLNQSGYDIFDSSGMLDGKVDDYKGWGLAGSYTFGSMAKIIGQYESFDVPVNEDNGSLDWKSWSIVGEYYMGNHTFRALYGSLDYDIDDDSSWAVGYQYSFSKRTRVYAEYGEPTGVVRDVGNDNATLSNQKIGSFGVRHYF